MRDFPAVTVTPLDYGTHRMSSSTVSVRSGPSGVSVGMCTYSRSELPALIACLQVAQELPPPP